MTGAARPRLGFLGVGWIGRHRMEAMLATGAVTAAAIADPSPETVAAAKELAPEAEVVPDLDALLALDLDGIVIATPSALHAEQSIQALKSRRAVFCQKPLGRTAPETRAVVEAARQADRLLGVDLSYRHTEGMRRIRELVQGEQLGRIFAVDLVFHNAYGPDKPWFYDPEAAGGGCVIDLGVHLVDLALWTLGFPEVAEVHAHLQAGGRPLAQATGQVEDHAVATLVTEAGTVIRLACSWRLQAGCDAVISAEFYGTEGGAALRNQNGSFYDFVAERFAGTSRQLLAEPPDPWGAKSAAAFAQQLARCPRFDGEIARITEVAAVLDRIYGR
ncbi:MAG TPA: Gfo/Idh/MocA family oxidoreductase [Geminicoccus sp.]|uniref:Gfo/Idh/MocA family protein n=1 Tax=Geminicoccus sp. TaxID=2024832 RepID=UPI002D02F14B|nr:Gfo/Idh/MocA family oxidoreductase [Geminicoccus sp.]HWL68725.1 Gfo/Idh/MocA family oxidoreductase [Geminicoccus sp.]